MHLNSFRYLQYFGGEWNLKFTEHHQQYPVYGKYTMITYYNCVILFSIACLLSFDIQTYMYVIQYLYLLECMSLSKISIKEDWFTYHVTLSASHNHISLVFYFNKHFLRLKLYRWSLFVIHHEIKPCINFYSCSDNAIVDNELHIINVRHNQSLKVR